MGFSIRRGVANFVRRTQRLAGKSRCSVCLSYLKNSRVKTLQTCKHSYCKNCLRKTYIRAMNEPEAILPPRCCGYELTMAFAGDFLEGEAPAEVIGAGRSGKGGTTTTRKPSSKGFKELYLELLEIRTLDPIFCARCRAHGKEVFIPPEEIQEDKDLAVCRKCNRGTCTLCKKQAPHKPGGSECDIQGDEAKQDIRYQRLSGRSGWRRCDGCSMMVSRDAGCSHVVCRCGQDVWLAF